MRGHWASHALTRSATLLQEPPAAGGGSTVPRTRTSALVPEGAAGRGPTETRPVLRSMSTFVDRSRLFLDSDEMKQRVRKALLRPTWSVNNLYHEKGLWQSIARSAVFEYMALLMIVANALYLAVDTDYNTADNLLESAVPFQVMEHLFCSFFTLELLVRFLAYRSKLNIFQDVSFLFDSALVALMIVDTWIMTLVMAVQGNSDFASPLKSMTGLRLIRLFRLARMAKIIRLIPELAILIKGMVAAMRSVVLVLGLLMAITFVFAIVMTEYTANMDVGRQYFSTVALSTYTLVVYGTFLDSLSMCTDALKAETSVGLAIFFLYVMLAQLTVLNVLIGVLCEVVSAVSAAEKEEMTVTFVTGKMKEILQHLDSDYDMEISMSEFNSILQHPEAAQTLKEVGVDPVSIVDFTSYIFDVMEGDEDQNDVRLNFEEFMEAVLQLRGTNTATVRDIVDLRKFVYNAISDLQASLADPGQKRRVRQRLRTTGARSANATQWQSERSHHDDESPASGRRDRIFASADGCSEPPTPDTTRRSPWRRPTENYGDVGPRPTLSASTTDADRNQCWANAGTTTCDQSAVELTPTVTPPAGLPTPGLSPCLTAQAERPECFLRRDSPERLAEDTCASGRRGRRPGRPDRAGRAGQGGRPGRRTPLRRLLALTLCELRNARAHRLAAAGNGAPAKQRTKRAKPSPVPAASAESKAPLHLIPRRLCWWRGAYPAAQATHQDASDGRPTRSGISFKEARDVPGVAGRSLQVSRPLPNGSGQAPDDTGHPDEVPPKHLVAANGIAMQPVRLVSSIADEEVASVAATLAPMCL